MLKALKGKQHRRNHPNRREQAGHENRDLLRKPLAYALLRLPTHHTARQQHPAGLTTCRPKRKTGLRAMMGRLPPEEAARVNKMTQNERRAFFQQMRERRQQQQQNQ